MPHFAYGPLTTTTSDEDRMGLMSIAEIINEIDVYLARLRNARDLLKAPVKEVRRKSEPRRKRSIRAKKTDRSVSSKPRVRENESRLDRMVPPVTPSRQRVDSLSRVRGSVAPKAAASEPPVVVPVQKQQDIRIERLPAPNRQIRSTRTERRPVTKRASGATLEYPKPAIALAGPAHSKIVVVSAEQAQREREQAAQSSVRRPRAPRTGLTGKAAFEALFDDDSDTSETSRG